MIKLFILVAVSAGSVIYMSSGFVLGYMDQPWTPPPFPDVRLEPDLVCNPDNVDCMIRITGLDPNWAITAYPDLINQCCLGSAPSRCSAMYSYYPYVARLYQNDTDLTFDNATLN